MLLFTSPCFKDKRNSTGNLYFTDALERSDDGIPQTVKMSNSIFSQNTGQRDELRSGSALGSTTSIESTATTGSSTNDLHGSQLAVSMELRTAAGKWQIKPGKFPKYFSNISLIHFRFCGAYAFL